MLLKNKFKLRKNDRFHYTPRYYKGSKENAYGIKYKFDRKERELNYNDFKGQWSEARKESRVRSNYQINTRLLIIIALLIFVFLYLIDFDLSIFRKQ